MSSVFAYAPPPPSLTRHPLPFLCSRLGLPLISLSESSHCAGRGGGRGQPPPRRGSRSVLARVLLLLAALAVLAMRVSAWHGITMAASLSRGLVGVGVRVLL